MLPSFLYSTYKQYKEDTAYIATWLARTAKACGSTSSLFHAVKAAPVVTAKKPKPGKAKNKKKAARDAARRIPADQREQKQHIIPLKEFVPLAQDVANFDNPPIEVPQRFVRTAERCIQARERSGAYFNTFESGHSEDTDGHLYFINILKSVFDILKPRFPAYTIDKESPTPGPVGVAKGDIASLD